MGNVINLSYTINQDLKRHISNIATTNNEIIQQGLGLARPNKRLSQRGKNFQELKISGHGTILALTNNRKTRTARLIQPTVLVFLVIRLKYCFTEPLQWHSPFWVREITDADPCRPQGSGSRRKGGVQTGIDCQIKLLGGVVGKRHAGGRGLCVVHQHLIKKCRRERKNASAALFKNWITHLRC